jgi:hypothetical protein
VVHCKGDILCLIIWCGIINLSARSIVLRVKKYLKSGRGLACLGLLLAGGLLSSATNLTVSSAGRVTYVTGITNVHMSQLVGAGYRLRTGLNGRAELTFANGYRLRVGPNSDLILVAYRPVQNQTLLHLNQEHGHVTYDDINDILPDGLSPNDLDELYTKLRNLDVEIVDHAESVPSFGETHSSSPNLLPTHLR